MTSVSLSCTSTWPAFSRWLPETNRSLAATNGPPLASAAVTLSCATKVTPDPEAASKGTATTSVNSPNTNFIRLSSYSTHGLYVRVAVIGKGGAAAELAGDGADASGIPPPVKIFP